MSMQPERLEFSDRVEYTLNGKLHREDGPAIEYVDGSKEWYLNGKLHRSDGPAIEWASGSKEWYVDGKRHRLDGPARVFANRDKAWYLEDQEVSKPDVDNLRLKTLTLSFVLNRRIWRVFVPNNVRKTI